jgi:hypothetical protein
VWAPRPPQPPSGLYPYFLGPVAPHSQPVVQAMGLPSSLPSPYALVAVQGWQGDGAPPAPLHHGLPQAPGPPPDYSFPQAFAPSPAYTLPEGYPPPLGFAPTHGFGPPQGFAPLQPLGPQHSDPRLLQQAPGAVSGLWHGPGHAQGSVGGPPLPAAPHLVGAAWTGGILGGGSALTGGSGTEKGGATS